MSLVSSAAARKSCRALQLIATRAAPAPTAARRVHWDSDTHERAGSAPRSGFENAQNRRSPEYTTQGHLRASVSWEMGFALPSTNPLAPFRRPADNDSLQCPDIFVVAKS